MYVCVLYLGAVAYRRRATIALFMSVRLSLHMYQFDSNWTEFSEIRYCRLPLKSVEKLQMLLESDKKLGTLYEDLCTAYCCRRNKMSIKVLSSGETVPGC